MGEDIQEDIRVCLRERVCACMSINVCFTSVSTLRMSPNFNTVHLMRSTTVPGREQVVERAKPYNC